MYYIIVEETHYYPFGLTMSGISSQALNFGGPENKMLYDGGIEIQNKEFSDGSGLELYATNYRSLDPQLGRFWQPDPLADIFARQSPYSYANNNPISFNDPLGDSTTPGNTLPDVVLQPGFIKKPTTFFPPIHTFIPSNLQPSLIVPEGVPIVSPELPVFIPPINNPSLKGNGDIFNGMDWFAMFRDVGNSIQNASTQLTLQMTILWVKLWSSTHKSEEKTADEVLPGSLKRSPSYYPPYGDKTRSELEKMGKQGDQKAKKMKKLIDQVDRLLDKNKNK